MARLLPRPRPDTALCVHEAGLADPAVVRTAPALGAEVATTSGTDRTADEDISRRHDRCDAPGSGGSGPVDHHDALLRRSHGLPQPTTGVVPRLLDGAHRTAARRLPARPSAPARRTDHRRALPRVHGGRDGHARAHLRLGRNGRDGGGPGRDRPLSGCPPQRQGGPGRLRPPGRFLRHAREVRSRFDDYLDRFPVRIEVM
jgi:hypothetical protein